MEYDRPKHELTPIKEASGTPQDVQVDRPRGKAAEQRLAVQYKIAHILAESNSINSAASKVVQLICELMDWEFGALWHADPETNTLVNEGIWHAPSASIVDFADATRYSTLNGDDLNLPGQVWQTGQPVWVSNLVQDMNSARAIEADNAGLHSGYAFPIRSGKKVTAVVECFSHRIQQPDQNLMEMMNAVGNQIGIFLDRKWLEEALTLRASQQKLLAQAGIVLSTSFDYSKRLINVARLVVPDIADWCVIDGVDLEQKVHRLVSFHVDPAKTRLVNMFQVPTTIGAHIPGRSVDEALVNGRSLLFSDITPSDLAANLPDSSLLEVAHRLNPRSAMIVPLHGHGRILGIFVFVLSDSGRRYNSNDLGLAEELARRVGLAMENARLYAEAQKLNVELEQRVAERTRQLEAANASLTRQVSERRQAEEKVQILNAELEQRVVERTQQLEILNRQLQNEITEHKIASEKLRTLLKRTRELYRLSKAIGSVREPNEVFPLLLSSSFLRGASRASIAIFDQPWTRKKTPPRTLTILAEWNKDASQASFVDQRFTLEEYGVASPVPKSWPIIIEDIPSTTMMSDPIRQRFIDLHSRHLIIFPLYAGGDWYGLLSLHFKSRRVANVEDLQHVRGLVSEAAVAINNTRLLEVEARARREAEQADNLKLKFLAMISHELRTPLTSIKGFATTLLADDVVWDPVSQRDFLRTIDSEADKLGDLIEQLLDLSRIEAGTLRITPQPQTIQDVIEMAKSQLQALTRQHELRYVIPPELPPINVDGQRIAQVLTNLVGNAARYSPPGTIVTISTAKAGRMVRVDVSDQGPGIPAQDRARVFEAFRQGDARSDHLKRGAGLGLAICKGLIQAHGGQIWIQDSPGPGTVMSFTLPLFTGAGKMKGFLTGHKTSQV